MKFGPVPAAEAEGAILVHALRLPGGKLSKGRILDAEAVQRMTAAGVTEIIVARLEPGDIGEDEAAARAAKPLTGPGTTASEAFTGRVNLFASRRGLLAADPAAIDTLNRIDESITVATLPEWSVVEAGQMLATIKVIPYASPAAVVEAWENDGAFIQILPFTASRVSLIQTALPSTKATVLAKTVDVTRRRVEHLDSRLIGDVTVGHNASAVAEAIAAQIGQSAEMILICGASAIIDRRDVIPTAIEQAGGEIQHFGMPVDPGNLILVGKLNGIPVLGLPGCARSPKLNGFDFVLQRLLAGLPIGRDQIMRMGVGGLLAEIWTRPLPRAEAERKAPKPASQPQIAALILAAGRSSRMGRNKLTIEIDGKPLIRHAVEAALASRASPVMVVTGHEGERVRVALEGLDVGFIENPYYADGLSSSVKAGVAALPGTADGAIICLGDMPGVDRLLLDRIIAAFNPIEGRAIVVPQRAGKRGNPVLWGRRFFSELATLSGDVGAKHLIAEHADLVAEIEAPDEGVLIDLDTPEALALWKSARGL